MAKWDDKNGRVVCLANRYDEISIRDYDRVRMYPVVRDGLAQQRMPLLRANFHFSCARQDIADLAMQQLRRHIRPLIEDLVRGAQEFGYQAVEKRWMPVFDVTVTDSQSNDGKAERYYPFVWTIRRFAAFAPNDTKLLIFADTGDFGGVRQFVGQVEERDVPASKCIHLVNERQFDSNYGMPQTKSAVPFVELAESNYDDLALHSKLFAVPWKIGRHAPGRSVAEDGTEIDNAALMDGFLSSIEAGHNGSLPAEYDKVSGKPLWDLTIQQPPGEENYVEKAQHINDMIRIAITVPEMASSSAPDTGTYNLGETQIELFLANVESRLDQLKEVIDEQLLKDFVLYNCGPDAPPCTIVFEPLDSKGKRLLFQGLIQMLSSGEPLSDGDGGEYRFDFAKLAEDYGVALQHVDARSRAKQLVDALQNRLKTMDAPDRGQNPKLSEYDESKHPRQSDGKFAPKDEAENIEHGAASLKKVIETQGDENEAMFRPELGHIAFKWGHPGTEAKQFKDGYGISHLIERRKALGQDVEKVLSQLPETLAKGQIKTEASSRGRQHVGITHNGIKAVLSPDFHGDALHWLLTAFEEDGKR